MSSALPISLLNQMGNIKIDSPLSSKTFSEQIASFTADHIAWISTQIAQCICNSLGPLPKLEIDKQVRESKGEFLPPNADLQEIMRGRYTDRQNGYIFPQIQNGLFLEAMRLKIHSLLVDAFQTAPSFIEKGLLLQISTTEFSTLLKDVIKESKVILHWFDVPADYSLHFIFERRFAQEEGMLVFSMLEKSGGFQFHQTELRLNPTK